MRTVLSIILFAHGFIHFMGLAKAYDIGNMAQFSKDIPKPMGVLWLVTGLLFVGSAILHLMKKGSWPTLAIAAVVVSQVLIVFAWTDAKYGTIANGIIFIAATIAFGSQHFENGYRKDVLETLGTTEAIDRPITEKDLEPLPSIVQRYLHYVGAIGKPKVFNVKISFEGEMRDKGKDWFPFTSEQHNFFGNPTRLFFMKAKVKGIPTNGYHSYKKGGASMRIKLLSLFTVAHEDGAQMFPTETVTFFNDLCLFAPAALIDPRITWEVLDDLSVKASFTTNNTVIMATLYFNEQGQLINFISNDRYSVSEMKTYPFSTPTKNYKNINGYNLPTYGEAIWHYPDGEFVYGKFNVKSVEYNVSN